MTKPNKYDSDSTSSDDTLVAEDIKSKQNKQERKARKMISKLNLKPVKGVVKVILRRTDDKIIVIRRPDVFQSNHNYIMFGEISYETKNQKAQAEAIEACIEGVKTRKVNKTAVVTDKDSDDESEEIDTTGIDEKDIEILMSQANVGRVKAVKAMRRNENDLVNAIMELTII